MPQIPSRDWLIRGQLINNFEINFKQLTKPP